MNAAHTWRPTILFAVTAEQHSRPTLPAQLLRESRAAKPPRLRYLQKLITVSQRLPPGTHLRAARQQKALLRLRLMGQQVG